MVKNGRVEEGKTPSVVSGKKADHIEDGEPLAEEERPYDKGLKKAAKAQQPESEDEQE